MQEAPPTESNTTTIADRRAGYWAKRGPSNLPTLPSSTKHVITLVDLAREPIEPVGVIGPYKIAITVLVKDSIPIKYKYWHKKDSEWMVPSSLMELCW